MLSPRRTLPGAALAGLPPFTQILVFYLLYMAASGFGHWLMVMPGIEITVWPPNGVVMAVLLSTRRESWVWWVISAALGEVISNEIWFHNAWGPTLGYAFANALEVVFAAYLLGRFFPLHDLTLGSLRRVFGFLGIGVLAAPMLGATVGSTVSMLSGKDAFTEVWPLWWLGDATGVLVAAPLVFSAIQAVRAGRLPSLAQGLEAALIGGLILAFWSLVIAQHQDHAFLMFVPILWAAVRFEITGTAAAIFLLVALIGFFAQAHPATDPGQSLVRQHAISQILVLVLATTGYVVAAAVRQHRLAVEALAANNNQLEVRVRERMQEVELAQRQFQTMFESAAVGMSIVDPCGTLLRVNPNFAEMLGYHPEEMEHRHVDSFTHPDDVQKTSDARDQLHDEVLKDSYVLEKRYLRKDGEIVWGLTSVSCVRGPDGAIILVIKIIQDISARKEWEATRQMLMHEVNHRSKNLLSLIQAIARQTGAKASHAFYESFTRRLHALAANQDILVRNSWESIQIQDLIKAQLAPFGAWGGPQFRLSGPDLRVSARAAQGLGMALHELATNAAKYGSLSTDTGTVVITWHAEGDSFGMTWQETGGPAVLHPPKSTGFGTTVIDTLIRSTFGAEVGIDYAPGGLTWRCRFPLSALNTLP